MSLPTKKPQFFGSALLGACCAVLTSVPVTAYMGAAFGSTYNQRAMIYIGFLLWVIAGAVSVFILTYQSQRQDFRLRDLLLWFFSTWLWPLLVITRLINKNK